MVATAPAAGGYFPAVAGISDQIYLIKLEKAKLILRDEGDNQFRGKDSNPRFLDQNQTC
jgi:hypothetical protein